jgi:hypothetical protein
MAMETALLNCSVSEVIQLLKKLLKKEGYEIENIDPHETIVLAYRSGKLFSKKKRVMFQISSPDGHLTRIDVTATIEGRKKSKEDEEALEEKIVSGIYYYIQ